jgi:hypothetical protein
MRMNNKSISLYIVCCRGEATLGPTRVVAPAIGFKIYIYIYIYIYIFVK